MSEPEPSANPALRILCNVLWSYLAIGLALVAFASSEGLGVLVFLYLIWQIKLIWTDNHA